MLVQGSSYRNISRGESTAVNEMRMPICRDRGARKPLLAFTHSFKITIGMCSDYDPESILT